jgi:hypothetical protein
LENSLDQETKSLPIALSEKDKPYEKYRFRAVIDFIKLKIVTVQPSNFNTVRTRMETQYVDALNEGAGKAATEFIVTIQEPTSWTNIHKMLEKFTWDHPLAAPIEVVGIEIALDAYSRANDRDELVDMTALFYKFAAKLVSENRRTSGEGKHSGQGISTYRGLRSRLDKGFNIYVGDETDAVKQHMYLKETNHRNKIVEVLPDAERRARTEFTLTGSELPHSSLADWENHDFTKEADFFKYRKLKSELRLHSSAAVMNIAQVGARKTRKRECGGTRLYSVNTVADTALNDLAYSALRELTRRMKG